MLHFANTCNSMNRMIVHYRIKLLLMRLFKPIIRKRRKEERIKRRRKRRVMRMVPMARQTLKGLKMRLR